MEQFLYDSMYFGVARMHRIVSKVADDAFKSTGMSPTYGLLMMLLDAWKELTPSDISSSLDISPSTTTRFLDKLDRLGYISRRSEGIYSYVSLSPTGLQKLPEIKGTFEELEMKLSRMLTSRVANRIKPQIIDVATTIQEKTDD